MGEGPFVAKAMLKTMLTHVGLGRTYVFAHRVRMRIRLWRRIVRCKCNYSKIVRRIRTRPPTAKIKVLFLNNEIAKWKCQSVYEEMQHSGLFDPVVGITALGELSLFTDAQLDNSFATSERYFDGLGVRHTRVVSLFPKQYHDLAEYKPDIVFFPEPWAQQWPQTTEHVSRFALTCYVPYFVSLVNPIPEMCLQEMHRNLFAFFAQSETLKRAYSSLLTPLNHSYRLVVTGHPCLDYFTLHKIETGNRKTVIYAPHWTVLGGGASIQFSTFLETGRMILDYAKRHPEIKWVFKPHPKLRRHLLKIGIWNESEVSEYYAAWDAVGESYCGSEYNELFAQSHCLITDSASFLMEYAATGHPIIQLQSSEWRYDLFPYTRDLLETYYTAKNPTELQRLLEHVVERGEDPNRERRLAAVERHNLYGVNAAQNIVNYFRNLLQR